ncbi:MAG: hypothetical protein AB9836_13985 [Aminipila sp.]
MQEILNNYFPNVITKLPDFYESIIETLQMVARSGWISFVIGLVLGILLTVTKKREYYKIKWFFKFLIK